MNRCRALHARLAAEKWSRNTGKHFGREEGGRRLAKMFPPWY